MNNYSFICTSNYVSVLNLTTGAVTKISKDSPNFEKALKFIKDENFEAVEKMNIKQELTDYTNSSDYDENVSIERGVIFYKNSRGEKKELHNALTARILKMKEQGFNVVPMMKFLDNLMKNPSKTAVDELYLFLEASDLPITDDGHFIAYKMVRDDYTSIYDRTFLNAVGTVVEMDRNEVDENRNNTCSYGLHFCSKDYLKAYGSDRKDTDRLLLLKINPADVVTIPSDYNNAKGRASKYLILKDITEDNWRNKFSKQDFTDSAVLLTENKKEDDSLKTRLASFIRNYWTETEGEWEDNPFTFVYSTTNVRKPIRGYWSDELDFIEMLMAIEEEFECTFSDEVAKIIITFDDLLTAVKKAIVDELESVTYNETIKPQCPDCGYQEVTKRGFNYDGTKQRYKCKACKTNFYEKL